MAHPPGGLSPFRSPRSGRVRRWAGTPTAASVQGPAGSRPTALADGPGRGRFRTLVAMLGPAFVASIAYVDPGNFATNFQGGALFGYLLVWVVVTANLMAMLVQYLSAKLGIVTCYNLAELCGLRFRRSLNVVLWVQAEIVAMATDVAEFLGAAIGLDLLFHVPLFVAGLCTAAIAFGVLALQSRGYRPFELSIIALLALVVAGFGYETAKIGPSASASVRGLVPALGGASSAYLAVGIVGATVMPHAVYLHSALTQRRTPTGDDNERARLLRFERVDVVLALGMAGLVNLAMLAVAAKLFYHRTGASVTTLEHVHSGIASLVGGGAALVFAVALLASGVSSAAVGTFAGQVVMSGFTNFRISLVLRRALTMIPALIVLGLGLSATSTLVLSQVVLSFGIPFALIPLVAFTSRADIMGRYANGRVMLVASLVVISVIVALNLTLLALQVGRR